MKHGIIAAVALLFSMAAARAAPVPMDEIIGTPAGRWLLRELGTGEVASSTWSLRQLQSKWGTIRSRYRNRISSADGAFEARAIGVVAEDKQLVLKLIARDLIGDAPTFVNALASRPGFASSAAEFAQERARQTLYRGLGRFKENGKVFHVIERPVDLLPRHAGETPGEKTLRRLLTFLDVRIATPRVVVIPEAALLNQRIEALNVQLRRLGFEKIPVRFTELTPRSPLEAAALNSSGQIPILFDEGFHGRDPLVTLGSVLLVRPQIEAFHADFRVLKAFWEYVNPQTDMLRAAFDEGWTTLGTRVGASPAVNAASRRAAESLRAISFELNLSEAFSSKVAGDRIFGVFSSQVPMITKPANLHALVDEMKGFMSSEHGNYVHARANDLVDGVGQAARAARAEALGRRVDEISQALSASRR